MRPGGKDEDRHGPLRTDPVDHFHPVHVGQAEIENDRGRHLDPDSDKCRIRGGEDAGAEPVAGQRIGKQGADVGFVLDDEHQRAGVAGRIAVADRIGTGHQARISFMVLASKRAEKGLGSMGQSGVLPSDAGP